MSHKYGNEEIKWFVDLKYIVQNLINKTKNKQTKKNLPSTVHYVVTFSEFLFAYNAPHS